MGQALPVRPVSNAAARQERKTLRFTATILVAVLFLQRFGVPFAGKSISVVGPIGLAAVIIALASGALAINRARLLAFLVLANWIFLGTVWQETHFSAYGTTVDFHSMAQFLILTSFAMASFAQPLDEGRFFHQVNFFLALIAVAGLLQFAAQFIGIRIFEFTGLLPKSVLFESDYHLKIPAGFAGLFKANGFFLIEPSVFSQFMAVALIIEQLYFKRIRFFVLFAAGLILSFSGTGWIVLIAFVVSATFSLGGRGLILAIAMLLVLSLAIGGAVLLAPHIADVFRQRIAEFSEPGTSASLRFITPFWLAGNVLSRVPSAAVLGIGSGASEHILTLPYTYAVNTPVKIFLEYGAPALVAYVLLFVVGPKTRLQSALVLPGLVLVLFAGGYQQFPPVLFLILLLQSVAWLKPASIRGAEAQALVMQPPAGA